MELWIRSQKNEKLRPMLLKANEFEIGDYDEDMNCIVVNNLYCVGVYKTKERALEVLDEIQKILKPQLIIKDSGKIIGTFEDTIIKEGATYELKELSTYVYEMPKE